MSNVETGRPPTGLDTLKADIYRLYGRIYGDPLFQQIVLNPNFVPNVVFAGAGIVQLVNPGMLKPDFIGALGCLKRRPRTPDELHLDTESGEWVEAMLAYCLGGAENYIIYHSEYETQTRNYGGRQYKVGRLTVVMQKDVGVLREGQKLELRSEPGDPRFLLTDFDGYVWRLLHPQTKNKYEPGKLFQVAPIERPRVGGPSYQELASQVEQLREILAQTREELQEERELKLEAERGRDAAQAEVAGLKEQLAAAEIRAQAVFGLFLDARFGPTMVRRLEERYSGDPGLDKFEHCVDLAIRIVEDLQRVAEVPWAPEISEFTKLVFASWLNTLSFKKKR